MYLVSSEQRIILANGDIKFDENNIESNLNLENYFAGPGGLALGATDSQD